MARVRRHELLGGGDHGGQSALHVGGAAAVEQPVADLRGKRVAAPLLERTRGHDIRVSREAEDRRFGSVPRQEVLDIAKAQALDTEARGGEARGHDLLTAFVGGGDRAAGDQSLSQFNGLRHYFRGFDEPAALRRWSGARLYGLRSPRASGVSCHARANSRRNTSAAATRRWPLRCPGVAWRQGCHQSVTSLSSNDRQFPQKP